MPSALTTFGPRLIAGSALLVVLLVVNIIIRDRSTQALYRNTEAVAQAHSVINALDRVSTSVVDAETGERGFLITGHPNYLEPYNSALAELDGEMAHLAGLVADNPAQSGAVAALRDAIDLKLSQLRETIDVHQTQGPEAAVALVLTGRSKATMDAIRLQVRGMQAREQQALAMRAAEAESTYQRATVTGWATGLLGVVITVAFVWSARRNAQAAGRRGLDPLRGTRTTPRDAGQHRRRRDRHRSGRQRSACSTASPSSSPAGPSRRQGPAAHAGLQHRQRRHAQPSGEPGDPRAARRRHRRARQPHRAHLEGRGGTANRRQRRADSRGGRGRAWRRAGLPRRHRRSQGGDRAEPLAGTRAVVGRANAAGGGGVADHQRRHHPGQHRGCHRRRGPPHPRGRPLQGHLRGGGRASRRKGASWFP